MYACFRGYRRFLVLITLGKNAEKPAIYRRRK